MSELKFNYYADVKQGKLPYSVSQDIARDLKLFEGTRVEIILKKKRKSRSLNQNAYYWGVVISCYQQGKLDEQGEIIDKETAHTELKANCNYKEVVNEETGEVMRTIADTKNLNTLEAEEYYERCRKFIYNWFNIVTPLPDEAPEIDFK